MFDVVLLMAGSGVRTKLAYNKVFYIVNNKPLFLYSLEKFLAIPECAKVVMVVNEDDLDKVLQYQSQRVIITIGGQLRQDSVYNGLLQTTNQIVLIHDAARANVSKEDINKVYYETKKHGYVALAHKVTDTIKEVDNKTIQKTFKRDRLMAIETPQGIKRDTFINCLLEAKKNNYIAYDDLQLVEVFANINGKIIESSTTNLKVTTEDDLKIIKILMEQENV